MNKNIIFSMVALIFLLGSVSALIPTNQGSQYFKWTILMPDNVTMRYYSTLNYQPAPEVDTIKSGNPFQSYILYHTEVDTWNKNYPNSSVYYCSLRVDMSDANGNPVFNLNQENFTTSISNGQYFVNLRLHEAYYVYADCVFTSPQSRTNSNLQMPFDFSIVEPTNSCKACQFYEWINQRVLIEKARTLSDYTTINVGYIKGIFKIFYELAIISFWVGLILLLIFTIGLLFWAIYWLYTYLTKNIRI